MKSLACYHPVATDRLGFPHTTTGIGNGFEVWAHDSLYFNNPCSQLVATFNYLQEAIDYIAYANKLGVTCTLKSAWARLCGDKPSVWRAKGGAI